MNDFSLSRYAQFISITSVTFIIWGLITGVIKSSPAAWFGLGFFCLISLILGSVLYRGKS